MAVRRLFSSSLAPSFESVRQPVQCHSSLPIFPSDLHSSHAEMAHAAPKSNRSRIPHPILKRDSSPFRTPALPFSRGGGGPLSPHVHFPPTPGMSSTFPAYSPTTYDRKPIVISPNVVQLPRRGERRLFISSPDLEEPGDHERRGRRRSRSCGRERGARAKSDEGPVKGSYFHPHAYEACVPEPADDPTSPIDFAPPPLVYDLSPSDESDEVVLTPPGPGLAGFAPVSRSIPLRLPKAAKGRRNTVVESSGADLPPTGLVFPQPSPQHARGHRRSSSARVGRREREELFSPELDEGCLGGF